MNPCPDCPPGPAALLPTPEAIQAAQKRVDELKSVVSTRLWTNDELNELLDVTERFGKHLDLRGPREIEMEKLKAEIAVLKAPPQPVDVAETVEFLKSVFEELLHTSGIHSNPLYIELYAKKAKRITDAIGLILGQQERLVGKDSLYADLEDSFKKQEAARGIAETALAASQAEVERLKKYELKG